MVVRDSRHRRQDSNRIPKEYQRPVKPKNALFLPSESVASSLASSRKKKTAAVGLRSRSGTSDSSRESSSRRGNRSRGRDSKKKEKRSKSSSRGRGERSKSSSRANGNRRGAENSRSSSRLGRVEEGQRLPSDYYEEEKRNMRRTRFSNYQEEISDIDEDEPVEQESAAPSCFAEAAELVCTFPACFIACIEPEKEEDTDKFRYNYKQALKDDRDLPVTRKRGGYVARRE